MTSLNTTTVLITGASSGIGAACAKQFAVLGARLILTARRLDRIEALAKELNQQYAIEVLPIKLDVQNKTMVKDTLANLPTAWQAIDILINNAGLALTTDKLQDGNPDNWDIMIDTNVKGLLYVTRAILPGMLRRERGHIINIGSIAGREYYLTGNVYCATKHAVKAISKTLRQDLLGTPIRVSEVAPGAVNTEFGMVRWQDAEKANAFYASFEPLVADDIADGVIYCATRPARVNVDEIVIYPTCQAGYNIHKKGDTQKSVFD